MFDPSAHGFFDPAAVEKELRRVADTTTYPSETAALAAQRLAAPGVIIKLEAPDSLWIEGDRDGLYQVLLNLVDNACRVTQAPGRQLPVRPILGRTGNPSGSIFIDRTGCPPLTVSNGGGRGGICKMQNAR